MGERRRSGKGRRRLFQPGIGYARGVLRNIFRGGGHGETRARRVRVARTLQLCFFLKENKTKMTPSPAAIAAAVKPAVEISARD